MRVNFALEFPTMPNLTSNQQDMENNDPTVRYMITDDKHNIVQKNFKLNTAQSTQIENNTTTKSYTEGNKKITETTTVNSTHRKISKSKVTFQLPEDYYTKVPELREYVSSFQEQYKKVLDEEEEILDENNKLKNYVKILEDGQHGEINLKSKEEFEKYKHEYEKYKQESEETIRKLRTKIQHFDEDQEDFAKSLKNKIRNLQKELDDKDEELQETKKKLNEVDNSSTKYDDKMKTLKMQIEEKYKHFDELNRYINDLLKEKRKHVAQIDQLQRKVDNLELDLKRDGGRPAEKITFTERRVVDDSANERLEDARMTIVNLDKALESMRSEVREKETIIREKETEIIQIRTVVNEHSTKTNELKTKETQVVKLQAKERLGEWGQVLSIIKTLATNFKGLIEVANDEKIHDNLDLEAKEQTGLGYSEPIFILLDKLNKYYKDINRLLKNQPTGTTTEGAPKDRRGLQDLKNIFQEAKTSTDYFVELLRTVNKEKFVNFRHLEIDSEDPSLYLEGINEYFSFHEGYYKDIKEKINAKNAELLRLANFEKEILSGKNKAACLEDFRNVLEKNNKLNKTLVDIMNKLAGQELYKHDTPQSSANANAEQVLDGIFDQFDDSNKHFKFINAQIRDLLDERDNLKDSDKNGKNKNVDVEKLKIIHESAGKVNNEVKELLVITKEDLLVSEIRVDLESKNPDLYIESILNLHQKSISDIRHLKSLIKETRAELEQLKAFESEFKKGKNREGSLNDYRFILGKVEKVRENITEVKIALRMENAVFEIEPLDYEKPDDYIEGISRSVKESNKDINELLDILKDYNREVERLRIYEREVREGKNKEGALKDFKDIYNKSKDNLKATLRNVEKAQNDIYNDNLSQIFTADHTSKDLLNAIYGNMSKWEQYNKILERKIADLNEENERLKRFEKDVKSGKNKDAVVDDLKQILKQKKDLYLDIRSALDKARNERSKDELSIEVSAKDPMLYLEAISKYHDASTKCISELRDLMTKNNVELKRLQILENEVNSGENKVGALKDLRRVCLELVELAKSSKITVEKATDIKVYDMFDYDSDNKNPNYHIAYIDDSLNKLKRYNKDTTDGIDKLKDRLNKTADERKKFEIDAAEYVEVIKRKESEVKTITARLEKNDANALDFDQFVSILRNSNKIIKNMNMLTAEASGEHFADEVYFSESETSTSVLIRALNTQITLIDSKFEKLKVSVGSASDRSNPIELLKVLNKLEEFKGQFFDYYQMIADDKIEDPTHVDIIQARKSENCIRFLNADIDFLLSIIETFIESNNSKINNLVMRRNEILAEKEKIHTLYTDTMQEVNKKTTLIGSLQVKLFVLMEQIEINVKK